MYEQLQIHFEGQTEFVATDQEPKPFRLNVTCPAGLEAGADLRVTASTFHSHSPRWTLADPFVEGGEGVLVIGHGLPHGDWTDLTRGGDGPAGGGLVGRPVNEVYLCTVQVTGSLSPRSPGGLPLPHNAFAARGCQRRPAGAGAAARSRAVREGGGPHPAE